ncbi:MAG: secretin N-terminal domain-containing protein [Gemmataceae bacterium]
MRRNFAYKLRNAQAADVAAALNDFETKSLTVYNKNTFLGPFEQLQREVVVTPDPISNTLLINTSPERFDDVVKLIEQLDALPPQVMIQVLLAEVDLNDNQEFGVEIGLQSPVFFNRGNNGGAATSTSTFDTALAGGTAAGSQPGFNFNTTNPLPNLNAAASPGTVGWQGLQNLGVGRLSSASGVGGLVFSAASDSFNLLIRALKVQGRIDILSRPQVMTLDGQAASVAVGQDVPYLSSSSVTGTGVATQNIDRRTVGVLLQVQPKINPDGSVLMRVIPEVSNVNPTPINLGNGILGTVFNVQRIETTVSAWDGETVALGGLITRLSQKNENKVPWVGDLPGVGALFRYRTYQKKKTELIVIMTPHIVRCKADADRILAEESRRVDWILRDVHRLHTSGPAFGLNPDLKTIPLPGTIAPAPRPVPGDTPISALPGSGPPPLAKAGAAPAAATAPAPLSPAAVVPASTLPAAAKGLPAVPEHVIVIPAASPVAPPALTPPAAKVEAPAPGVAPTPVGGPGPVSVIDVPGPTGSTAAYPAGPRFVR